MDMLNDPVIDAPSEPIMDAPDNPNMETPKDPTLDTPRDHAMDTANNPIMDTTGDPNIDTPSDPIMEIPSNPTMDTTGDHILDNSMDYIIDKTKDPNMDTPGDPTINIPKDPTVVTPRDPTIDASGDPIMDTSGDHTMDAPRDPSMDTPSDIQSDPIMDTSIDDTMEAPREPDMTISINPIMDTPVIVLQELDQSSIVETIPKHSDGHHNLQTSQAISPSINNFVFLYTDDPDASAQMPQGQNNETITAILAGTNMTVSVASLQSAFDPLHDLQHGENNDEADQDPPQLEIQHADYGQIAEANDGEAGRLLLSYPQILTEIMTKGDIDSLLANLSNEGTISKETVEVHLRSVSYLTANIFCKSRNLPNTYIRNYSL